MMAGVTQRGTVCGDVGEGQLGDQANQCNMAASEAETAAWSTASHYFCQTVVGGKQTTGPQLHLSSTLQKKLPRWTASEARLTSEVNRKSEARMCKCVVATFNV